MKKILAGLLLLLVAAVGGVWLYSNELVGSAIERSASYALGVESRVGFVRLRLLRGDFALNGFRVANPPGFDEPHFLTLERARVQVDLPTLRAEVVRIPSFELETLDVALERRGKQTNYGVILQNLKRFEAKQRAQAAPPGEAAASGQRVIVERLSIRDVRAYVEWNELAPNQTGMRVEIPEIALRNIGAENARGVALAELQAIVVKAVLGSVARYGEGLPGAVLGGLDAGLGGLSRVGGVVVRGAGQAGVDEIAGELGGAARGAGGAAAKTVEELGRGVGRALGGLFEGEPKPAQEPDAP
jgi:hypothetical protein